MTIKEQEFIIWHYYNSLSYREIEKFIGYKITYESIRLIVKGALRKLRNNLTLNDL